MARRPAVKWSVASGTLPAGFTVQVTESAVSARRRDREDYEFMPGWGHAVRGAGGPLCGMFQGEPLYDTDDQGAVSCPYCIRKLKELAAQSS